MINSTSQNMSFANNISLETSLKEDKWKLVNLKEMNTNIYIKLFEATELNIDVSFIARFSNDIKFSSDQNIQNKNFFQSIGLALSTIENAPIRIKKMQLKNVSGSQKDINVYVFRLLLVQPEAKLCPNHRLHWYPGKSSKYAQDCWHWSPQFLYTNRSTGLELVLHRGGIGILKGTGSLFKNTAEGVFGWVSKITSSVSKGVLVFYRR